MGLEGRALAAAGVAAADRGWARPCAPALALGALPAPAQGSSFDARPAHEARARAEARPRPGIDQTRPVSPPPHLSPAVGLERRVVVVRKCPQGAPGDGVPAHADGGDGADLKRGGGGRMPSAAAPRAPHAAGPRAPPAVRSPRRSRAHVA